MSAAPVLPYLYPDFFTMEITKEKVLDALRYVDDPDLKKDLVTLNMIKDIEINGKEISFSVVLTTPACPMKDMIHNAKKMKGDVQTLAIHNGLHDLVLSAPPVRENVYQQLFQWLEQKIQ